MQTQTIDARVWAPPEYILLIVSFTWITLVTSFSPQSLCLFLKSYLFHNNLYKGNIQKGKKQTTKILSTQKGTRQKTKTKKTKQNNK